MKRSLKGGVSCRSVPKGVATGPLVQARSEHGFADGPLEDGLVQVMPPPGASGCVEVRTGRREHPLPWPLAAGVGKLPVERVGQLDVACPLREVVLVVGTDLRQMPAQGLDPPAGQQQRHEPRNTGHALDDGGCLRRREDQEHAL